VLKDDPEVTYNKNNGKAGFKRIHEEEKSEVGC
jgi:hypothetical protein